MLLIISQFLWFASFWISSEGFSCKDTKQQSLKLAIEDSLSESPEINSFTVTTSDCKNQFTISSTESKTKTSIIKGSTPNRYYSSKLKRVKNFCSVSSIRRSVLSTSRETQLVLREESMSVEKSWTEFKDSLTLVAVYIQDVVDLHCGKEEKSFLLESLYNLTLSELVGNQPWKSAFRKFPYEKRSITSVVKIEYLTFNFATDVVALSVLSGAVIISIPESAHCYVNNYRACIPHRLCSKISQSGRFVIMASLKKIFNIYTLSSFKQAYDNIVDGYFSQGGNFLHNYSGTESVSQKIRAYYPFDFDIYTSVVHADGLTENTVFLEPTLQQFSSVGRSLAVTTPRYSTLSPTQLQSLGFTNQDNELLDTSPLPIDVNFCSMFKLYRLFTSFVMLCLFWGSFVGFLAVFNLPPVVILQAFRRVLNFQI